jgi:hypothetical protein
MEAIYSPSIHKTAWFYNLEDHYPHFYRPENLKSHKCYFMNILRNNL